MNRVIPLFAQTATATIVIDGVTYRVPLIDAAGHLQVDVVSSALPALAATSTKQDTMITALQLIDDLQKALASDGTDRLNVNVHATGASEVKSIYAATAGDSTTRATAIEPTSGKKIRVTSVTYLTISDTTTIFEVYFGTGATMVVNPSKIVDLALVIKATFNNIYRSWPDGGGPVGDADEVLSIRTQADIGGYGLFAIHYREE